MSALMKRLPMSKSYPSKYHRIISNVEETHFWFRARRDMLRRVMQHFYVQPVGKKFLEVGFGTGELLSVIESLGFTTSGVDINEAARSYAKQRSHAHLYITPFLQFVHRTYDAIGLFDVLEHQKDDMHFLRHAHELLKFNGLIFLTVPAGPWLWSDMDRLSGHARRYTKHELLKKLNMSGFHPLWCNYWNALLFPFYVGWKLLSTLVGKITPAQFVSTINPILNNMFFYIITIENKVTLHMPFLFGTSLVVVARKERTRA